MDLFSAVYQVPDAVFEVGLMGNTLLEHVQ